MNVALKYCNNKFIYSLNQIKETKAIYAAFEALAKEIKKLNTIDQLNMYSVTTQFLDSLKNKNDSLNPLEVFILRSNSIVDVENETLKTIGLALGIIAISLSVVILSATIGMGIGILLGAWQTSLAFMTALLAVETVPLIVASASVASGIGVGLVSGSSFFKESKVKTALNTCVEAIKQSHLPESHPSEENNTTHDIGTGALRLVMD